MFDVASKSSFDELDSWIAEAAKFGCNPREIPIVLCANKVSNFINIFNVFSFIHIFLFVN